jgi:hypothetical protein
MQSAKDSFYVALRERLETVNPARTVVLNGRTQVAVVLAETLASNAEDMPADCFNVSFGAVQEAKSFARAGRPLLAMECTVAYHTQGASVDGCDRERALTALDTELLQICTPPVAARSDYAQSPAQRLGSNVFWQRPEFGEAKDENGTLRRQAKLTLFFFAEVSA